MENDSTFNESTENNYTAFNRFAPKTYGLNIRNDFSKYFCFQSNDHHILGLINSFNNEDRNDSDCSGIFNHICSILPQELLERIDSMCYQNDNDDKDDDSQAYVAMFEEIFYSIEQSINERMADVLSEKTVLEMSLNGKCQNDYPKLNERLKQLKKKLSMGFCCIIAVINTRRIYVANIGDNRAIICKDDNNLSIELSIRHDFKNQDEIERLKNLSIDIEAMLKNQRLGNMSLTRCLGNIIIKENYQNFIDLKHAANVPILCRPSVRSIPRDDSLLFLIIATSNLFETFEKHYNFLRGSVNDELLNIILELISEKNDLKIIPDLVCQEIFKFDNKASPSFCNQASFNPILLMRVLSDEIISDFKSTSTISKQKDLAEIQTSLLTFTIDNNRNKSEDDLNQRNHRVDLRNSTFSIDHNRKQFQQNLIASDEITAYVDFGPLNRALELEMIDYHWK